MQLYDFNSFCKGNNTSQNLILYALNVNISIISNIPIFNGILIFSEYLDSDANCPINIDSKSYEITKRNMETPDRWTFNEAAAHLYQLMKNDSYPRYLRSEMYKEYLNGMKKKTSVKGIRSVISFSAKKEQTSS
ncbi:regulator of G-protein signaling egl-10-like [Centruroides sculpturatus]|uniref:regulator of G-protein signaling egl-10-like n=1 Tax=Centruroides sculpturatus TaxID=218467 RepID=UPI000C6CBDC9|nr:regulator of G-protein signaling egl-10-like [Centruroides sculpturatus]